MIQMTNFQNRKTNAGYTYATDIRALAKRLENTTRTDETIEQFKAMPKDEQTNVKDVGGFVLGLFKQNKRSKANLISMTAIVLDADFGDKELLDKIENENKYSSLVYTTHKHTPDNMRFRWIIFTDREMNPDEYEAVSRAVAHDYNMDKFDDTTYEPGRLMFWPSTSKDGEYIFKQTSGQLLEVDKVLKESYKDWTDCSEWFVSSRKEAVVNRGDKQEDPLTKENIVGTFCRSYSIQETIEKFLPDTYIKTDDANRWTYKQGTTTGGLVIFENKFAMSYHGSDPASGQLLNAFDLVRVHKFQNVKEETGYKLMSKLAIKDDKVVQTMLKEKQEKASGQVNVLFPNYEAMSQKIPATDDSWTVQLMHDEKSGKTLANMANVVTILINDAYIKNGIGAFNEFTGIIEKCSDLPWWQYDSASKAFQDSDRSSLRLYLEVMYDLFASPQLLKDALAQVHKRNKFNPVKEYLDGLVWDGTPRVDTLFSDYLGVENNAYSQAVSRKFVVSAVARVYEPGCKVDSLPVLVGDQGIGKSYFCRALAGDEYFSDSIKAENTKEGYESLRGVWIGEYGELKAFHGVSDEDVKLFITKQSDTYRPAYAVQVENIPRKCVFIGTTNCSDFLKDYTGNRRFWPMDAGEHEPELSIFENLPLEREQIWAEAVVKYYDGEKLFMDTPELKEAAEEAQAYHTFKSVNEYALENYLNTLLPENWSSMSVPERVGWLSLPEDAKPEGTVEREKVCISEIWAECFKGGAKELTNAKQKQIQNYLEHLGWEATKNPLRFGVYGRVRGYIRKVKK